MQDYLEHSSGPWKHHKYIKKVGNRYYYPNDNLGGNIASRVTNLRNKWNSAKKYNQRRKKYAESQVNLRSANASREMENIRMGAGYTDRQLNKKYTHQINSLMKQGVAQQQNGQPTIAKQQHHGYTHVTGKNPANNYKLNSASKRDIASNYGSMSVSKNAASKNARKNAAAYAKKRRQQKAGKMFLNGIFGGGRPLNVTLNSSISGVSAINKRRKKR